MINSKYRTDADFTLDSNYVTKLSAFVITKNEAKCIAHATNFTNKVSVLN